LNLRPQKRHFFAMIVFVFATVLSSSPSRSLEFGLTPSHVFGVWLNINKVYLELESLSDVAPEALIKIEALTPTLHKEIKTNHIFTQAKTVQKNLTTMYHLGIPKQTPSWIRDYQSLEGERVYGNITPSQIFILSTEILNSLVEKYADITKGTKPVSQFYRIENIKEKATDDVFGLVDLMHRRLEQSTRFRESPSLYRTKGE